MNTVIFGCQLIILIELISICYLSYQEWRTKRISVTKFILEIMLIFFYVGAYFLMITYIRTY